MNIENAQYQNDLNGNKSCIKADVENITMFIPLDPNNRHYAEILKQVEAKKLSIKKAD